MSDERGDEEPEKSPEERKKNREKHTDDTEHEKNTTRQEKMSSALALPETIRHAEMMLRGPASGDEQETGIEPRGIVNYVENEPEWVKEAMEAREMPSVVETHVPGKFFFTPDVVKGFLDEPRHMENFDTYLTMELLIAVSNVLENENKLIRLSGGRILVVGDIHGNLDALRWVLKRIKDDKTLHHVVFLGDYVDRGEHSLDVINTLFLHKLADPKKIILLRGNNETLPVNYNYGFYDEIKENFLVRDRGKVFAWYNEIFGLLPLAALIDEKMIALHGGIPSGLGTLDRMDEIPSDSELPLDDTLFELLWNDPIDDDVAFVPSGRGERARRYGRRAFNDFLNDNGLSGMIVSHACLENGFEYYFDRKLLRIFSSPNYMGRGNLGTVAVVDENGNVSVEKIEGRGRRQ